MVARRLDPPRRRTVIDAREGGVHPESSPTADHTATFQAAIAESLAISSFDDRPTIIGGVGTWNVHELAWGETDKNPPSIQGEGVNRTVFKYNGAGGPGSYVFKTFDNISGTGAMPYSTLRDLTIAGWAGGAGDKIAESGVLWPAGGVGVDWGAGFEFVHINDVLGNAIDMLNANAMVNVYLNRMRFDGIGGYPLAIPRVTTSENRPIQMRQFTLDNNASSAFLTAVQTHHAAYYVDADTWGKGVVYCAGSVGLFIRMTVGRVELNKKLVTISGKKAAFYDNSPTADGGGMWIFDGVYGFSQAGEGTAMLRLNSDKTGFSFLNQSRMTSCKLVESDTLPSSKYTVPRRQVGTIRGRGPSSLATEASQFGGIALGHSQKQLDAREALPTSISVFYRPGDLILRDRPIPGTTGVGWVPVLPDATTPDALGTAGTQAIGAGDMTSGSAVLSGLSAGEFDALEPGHGVVVVGAGVASADLTTYVLTRDVSAQTVTLNNAASTTVVAATINHLVHVFRYFGDLVTYGTAAPTTGAWRVGEKRWKTNPVEAGTAGSKYIILGWICTVAGSPGTWLEMRTLTGN